MSAVLSDCLSVCLSVCLSTYPSGHPTFQQADPHALDEEQHGNPYRELCLLSGHRQPVHKVETLDCNRQGGKEEGRGVGREGKGEVGRGGEGGGESGRGGEGRREIGRVESGERKIGGWGKRRKEKSKDGHFVSSNENLTLARTQYFELLNMLRVRWSSAGVSLRVPTLEASMFPNFVCRFISLSEDCTASIWNSEVCGGACTDSMAGGQGSKVDSLFLIVTFNPSLSHLVSSRTAAMCWTLKATVHRL